MDRRWLLWFAAGAALPMALAGVLLPFRDDLDNANIALILVVGIVAIATSGRRLAAAAAALSSAAAFNLFFTHPYVSLRITSTNDLETGVSLLVVGLAVGELAARGRRHRDAAASRTQELQRFHGLATQVALDPTADFVVMTVAVELAQRFELTDCRLEVDYSDERAVPRIERDGTVWWGVNRWDTLRHGLPPWGVELPIWGHGRQVGRFVLVPRSAGPVEASALTGAVALADQAGAALAAGMTPA